MAHQEAHLKKAGLGGVTAAHLAAESGSAERLKMVIESGADVNATVKDVTPGKRKGKKGGVRPEACDQRARPGLYMENTTPLHLAAQGGHLQCVRLLLDHGANVNAMNIKKRTPLYLAATMGHPECMKMLLQRSGGDCPDVSESEDMALRECFRHGERMRECITELVHRGADVSRCNKLGVSAVHQAVNNNWDLDMMKLLIVEGRGMDFDKTEGESPLQRLMDRQVWHYRDGVGADPPDYTEVDESTTLLFLRMGASRKDLKKLLWYELNLPKPSGVLLETLMDSFDFLPSLSELDAVKPRHMEDPSDTLWEIPEEMSEEARLKEDERLKEIVAEKKRYYHQRSTEVPSLAHLSRASIRSSLQADVRKVISWPVPECYKRFILLDYKL